MRNKAVIVSGYFNPLHMGHIEYFYEAKKHANNLIVIVNNDYQRELKGSKEFMLEDERLLIINELKIVNTAVLSIDKDRTVRATIRKIYKRLDKSVDVFFANGGDQNNHTIPEAKTCQELGIRLIDGLGKKIQSSSWLLNESNEN